MMAALGGSVSGSTPIPSAWRNLTGGARILRGVARLRREAGGPADCTRPPRLAIANPCPPRAIAYNRGMGRRPDHAVRETFDVNQSAPGTVMPVLAGFGLRLPQCHRRFHESAAAPGSHCRNGHRHGIAAIARTGPAHTRSAKSTATRCCRRSPSPTRKGLAARARGSQCRRRHQRQGSSWSSPKDDGGKPADAQTPAPTNW